MVNCSSLVSLAISADANCCNLTEAQVTTQALIPMHWFHVGIQSDEQVAHGRWPGGAYALRCSAITYDVDSASIPPHVSPPQLCEDSQRLLCSNIVVCLQHAI